MSIQRLLLFQLDRAPWKRSSSIVIIRRCARSTSHHQINSFFGHHSLLGKIGTTSDQRLLWSLEFPVLGFVSQGSQFVVHSDYLSVCRYVYVSQLTKSYGKILIFSNHTTRLFPPWYILINHVPSSAFLSLQKMF